MRGFTGERMVEPEGRDDGETYMQILSHVESVPNYLNGEAFADITKPGRFIGAPSREAFEDLKSKLDTSSPDTHQALLDEWLIVNDPYSKIVWSERTAGFIARSAKTDIQSTFEAAKGTYIVNMQYALDILGNKFSKKALDEVYNKVFLEGELRKLERELDGLGESEKDEKISAFYSSLEGIK